MVDYHKYEAIDTDDPAFVDLRKNVLCRDYLFYPVFLPNGFIDILTIRNKHWKCRVAQDTTKKYGNSIREWGRGDASMEFSVFEMKGTSDHYMLESLDKLYAVVIVVEPFRIPKKIIYKDGYKITRTVRMPLARSNEAKILDVLITCFV